MDGLRTPAQDPTYPGDVPSSVASQASPSLHPQGTMIPTHRSLHSVATVQRGKGWPLCDGGHTAKWQNFLPQQFNEAGL